MNKSGRPSAGSNTKRRHSQPVYSFSAVERRRGSDNAGPSRGNEPTQGAQYEEKVAVLEAKGLRKTRGLKEGPDGMIHEADHYNPDGSLRTVHRMPDFNHSYSEAMKARYLRPKETFDRDKELSLKQIFGKE